MYLISKCREIESIVQQNHRLIEADILLQFLLVRVCPNSSHHLLFQSVLSPVILTCLGESLIHGEPKVNTKHVLCIILAFHYALESLVQGFIWCASKIITTQRRALYIEVSRYFFLF